MWTSVKLIDSADIDIIGEVDAADIKNPSEEAILEILKKQKGDNLGIVIPKTSIEEVKDDNGKPIKYVIRGATRKQQDYARKTYEIGNHNYLKNYGTVSPNQPVTIQGKTLNLFPNESEKNPLLKPLSGITSISSETEGALGLIKKTTVNFVVHNFRDFDKIFSKYFLAPGAQVFVDFGFADIPNLYRPEDLIKHAEDEENDGVQGYLYDTKTGIITKNQGDLEVLQGIVIDYDAKIKIDGGVECSVTLTSKNGALLSFETDDDVTTKIKSILTRGILYLGLRAVVESGDIEDEDGDLKQLISTPNINSNSDSIETYNKNLLNLAKQELSGEVGPTKNSIRTGVFVENLNADNTYIAWGLFEDLIINSQFGFGEDNEHILNGKNLEVKMNSKNSFTKWTELNREKQSVLMRVPESPPNFMYPDWWAGDDPKAGTDDLPEGQSGGSYSYQNNKSPEFLEYEGGELISTKSYQNGDFSTELDRTIGRIPIREVFINTDMIIKAFESNSDVKSVILEILSELNKEGDGLFDWKMKEGDAGDSEIQIIDANYTIASENEKIKIEENPFFVFKVQSPNSMIKDYNLEFKLPSGNIGNMYAIQGLGVGDSLFSTNPRVKQAIATGVFDKDLFKIIYEPDLGNYRAKQLLDEPKVDSETFNVFQSIDNLFDDNIYKISTTLTPELIPDKTFQGEEITLTSKTVETKKTDSPKLSSNQIIAASDASAEALGFKVAKTFKEYYKFILSASTEEDTPNLLPYTLSLTIFGISSIQVGDTFKVDYLPRRYIENSYLQVIKVSHDIGPGGWFTTLETQFRLLPTITKIANNSQTPNKIVLSPNAITNLGFEDKIEADRGTFFWGSEIKIATFSKYMKNVRIEYNENYAYDYAIDFEVAIALQDDIKKEKGAIQNFEGNFHAKFEDTNDFLTAVRSVQSTTEADNEFAKQYGHMSAQEPETFSGILDSPFNKSSIDLGYHYLLIYKKPTVCPPDITLVPGQEYKMLVYGDKIAILDPTNPYYEKTLAFFRNYVGDYTQTKYSVRDELQGGGVCFVKGTKISMADDSEKNIEEISIGDEVKSWNEVTDRYENNFVTKTYKHKVNESLLMLNNLIKTTTNHPFYSNNQWVDAGDLKVGSEIVHISGEKHKIKNIQSIDNVKMVYNFEVENTHTYFAENYLVHNK